MAAVPTRRMCALLLAEVSRCVVLFERGVIAPLHTQLIITVEAERAVPAKDLIVAELALILDELAVSPDQVGLRLERFHF